MNSDQVFDPEAFKSEIHIPFPAPPSHFDECIKELGDKLAYLGKVVMDSRHHPLERENYIAPGTQVQAIVLVRETSLFFHLPGRAFFLMARYCEMVKNAAVWEGGMVVGLKKDYDAHWFFEFLVGMKEGLSWVDASHPDWLRIESEFGRDNTIRSGQFSNNSAMKSAGYVSNTEPRSDVRYRVSLAYSFNDTFLENYVTHWRWSVAVGNLVQVVKRFARLGRLGSGKYPTSLKMFAFSREFKQGLFGDDESFWSQCPPETLAPAFELIPVPCHRPHHFPDLR